MPSSESSVQLRIINDTHWVDHRSGWYYVLSLLKKFDGENGIHFDGCIDKTFGYLSQSSVNRGLIPYKSSWVGFLHHPINICPWYEQENLSPEFLLNLTAFKESLTCCKAIFTLSDHLAKYLRLRITQVPVKAIYHPTELDVAKFNYGRFKKSKKLTQVGCWMRELTPFFNLHAIGYQKYMPFTSITDRYLRKEIIWKNCSSNLNFHSVRVLRHLDNNVYDSLLSESVVFLNLYDSSANNAIIECIARNTPVLVNRLPAVVEYLGDQYPLYYDEINEAEEKIQNQRLIRDATDYLASNQVKNKLSAGYFLKEFSSVIEEANW